MKEKIVFEKKLGSGSYGIVYEAKIGDVAVAIKRNIIETNILGIGSIKEVDALARCTGHPFIVNLTDVCFGNSQSINFPYENIAKNYGKYYTDDKIHFVFQLEKSSLYDFISSRKFPPKKNIVLNVAAQLLLSAEWFHSKGIIHRDIKPGNILFNKSNDFPIAKMCDFGLSGNIDGAGVSTPGMTTVYYRAPEIIIEARQYNEKVDAWSIGCVIYELLTGLPLFRSKNTTEDIFKTIIETIPESLSSESAKDMCKCSRLSASEYDKLQGKVSANIRHGILENKDSLDVRIQKLSAKLRRIAYLPAKYVLQFDQDKNITGKIDDLFILIAKLVMINPNERCSVTEALEDNLFSGNIYDQIKTTRKFFPPVNQVLPYFSYMPYSSERDVAFSLICRIYNSRETVCWYDHRVILHALSTFDKYLVTRQDFPEMQETKPAEDSQTTYIRMYALFYLYYKYFISCLESTIGWAMFSPSIYNTDSIVKQVEDFERFIVRDILKCVIYNPGIFEIIYMAEGYLRESKIRDSIEFLMKLTNTPEIFPPNTGSIRNFYRNVIGIGNVQKTPTASKSKLTATNHKILPYSLLSPERPLQPKT